MSDRQARELGEALAFLSGDLRDEPLRCGWCHSTVLLTPHPERVAFRCGMCGRETSMLVAYELREQRLRVRVEQGAGAPILALGQTQTQTQEPSDPAGRMAL